MERVLRSAVEELNMQLSGEASVEFSQSLPLCIIFSAASGLLRVVATMVLAYPSFLETRQNSGAGFPVKVFRLATHLFILVIVAILSILGAIYGPISIAVPITTATSLLFNVVAMGIILKMREFDKAQRTGTYVVFFSILSLIDVGPNVQHFQDALELLSSSAAITWSLIVTLLLILACVGTGALISGESSGTYAELNRDVSSSAVKNNETLILAIGTTMSNVGIATAGKAFGSLHGPALGACVIYYLFCALAGVLFSVVSSTACDQGVFTPLSSVSLIVTNMIAGIIIWEDWKVIDTWVAYICSLLLMCCGVYLLAEIDLLEKFYRRAVADVVLPPDPSSTLNEIA